MKYRFYGDELQLTRFEMTWEEQTPGGETVETVYPVSTASERDEILARHPDASVTEIDNAGYEWMDGMTFTQEQRCAGEVERAAELGQEAYEAYQLATDPAAQMLELDYRLSLLELGVTV